MIPVWVNAQCSTMNSSLWINTWESCETKQSPNSNRGEGHWIMYDLGKVYTIGTSRLWNSNIELDKGIKQLIVDYSIDGTSWTFLDTLEVAQAQGNSEYAGVSGPNFQNVELRYILFHIESNWGHSDCTGFAEVKFMINNQAEGTVVNEDNDEGDEDNEDDENEAEDESEEDEGSQDSEEETSDDDHDECEEDENEETEEECSEPLNVTALLINPYEAWILWDGENADSYLVSIRSDGEDWIELEAEEPESYIEELEPEVEYEIFVEAICGEDENLKSETIRFTMPEESDECTSPSYSSSFISNEGYVIIIWQGSEGAEEYELRYRPIDSDEEWITIQTEENIIEFEDVDNEKEYEYQIRTNCDGDWTEWSETFVWSSNNEFNEGLVSNTEEITEPRSISNNLGVKVLPNPAHERINFKVDSEARTVLLIQLNDISGRSFHTISRRAKNGENQYHLDLNNIQSGMYFLTIRDLENHSNNTSRVLIVND